MLEPDVSGWKAEENFRSAVFVVFGKSGYRDMQTEFVFDDLAHHFHLSFAAIG